MVKLDREECWLDPETEPETDTEDGETYMEQSNKGVQLYDKFKILYTSTQKFMK